MNQKTTLDTLPEARVETLPADNTPQSLIAMAIRQGTSVDQLEKLMDLQDRWDKKQARKAFYEALAKFQKDCPVIRKNREANTGTFKYAYATLDNIIEQVKDPLQQNGLAYRFEFKDREKEYEVSCIITHCDGHSEATTMKSKLDTSGSKGDLQQIGSTLTYLQRYTLIGALGIATAQVDIPAPRQQEQPRAKAEPPKKKEPLPIVKKPIREMDDDKNMTKEWSHTLNAISDPDPKKRVSLDTVKMHYDLTPAQEEKLKKVIEQLKPKA